MIYAIYDIATTLTAPVAAGWLALRPRLRPLLARFHPQTPSLPGRPVWFQACSVGELGVTATLIRRSVDRWPDTPFLISASTLSGRKRAGELLPDTPFAWFPVDQRNVVSGFLRRVRPRMVVLVETEIWPNVIRLAKRSGVPVVIVNGRISDRHYPRYLRYRTLLRPVLQQLSGVGAQNPTYAERFERLGVPHSRIRVTGNAKFDGLLKRVDEEKIAAIRAETGLVADGPVVVFGSTRPGDEVLAAACWRVVREAFPQARLVVAPRHLERVPEARSLFDEPVRLRSAGGTARSRARVVVVDTLGELIYFYALADIAVVGGSFFPGVNGHNPLEPAALGIPTVFGPYMSNFMDPATALVSHGGAVQVDRPEELCDTLMRLMHSPEATQRLVACARSAIRANEGATERTVEFLDAILNDGASR